MTTFVLVSGAWHAGWCWERIVPLLESAGHRVFAPDLLGMGGDDTPLGTVTLARWADQVADLIRDSGDQPVVLVGHSRGGIVISEVAERLPGRIATLVYLSAFLVRPGETLLSTSARFPREALAGVVVMADDRMTTTVEPEAVGPAFYNTTETSWVERAKAHLTPEPTIVFATPLQLTDGGFGSVPRAYIECTQDNALPIGLQRLMQADLPCSPVFTLDTDHSPFYSAPQDLAACLRRLAPANI